MLTRRRSFAAIRRLMDDSAPLRAMSLVHRFALHDGDGGAGGGAAGGAGGAGGDGGDGGEGGDGGTNALPPEQQIGALKGKNTELLNKLKRDQPFARFAKGLGIPDVSKITPAQLDRLKAALKEDDGADAGAGKGDKGLDARIKALQDGHATELAGLKGRNEKLGTALDKAMRRNAAADAISEHGGRPKLLQDHVDKHVKLVEDEEGKGDFRVVVLDDEGEIRYNSKGKEMTPSEYVASLKESGEWDGAFNAPNSTGGGSNANKGGKGAASTGGAHVISEADARDTAKYRAARKAAADAGVELKIRP